MTIRKTNVMVNQISYHLGHTYSWRSAQDFRKRSRLLPIYQNYDNSDIQTDYFDIGYYVDIRIW